MLLSTFFVACKKDETSNITAQVQLRGKYSFNNNTEVVLKRWGFGGVEKEISSIEKDPMLNKINNSTEGVYYEFVSDSTMNFVDTVSNSTLSLVYKIDGDVVYFIDYFVSSTEYVPLFKISDNGLYIIQQKVDFKIQNATSTKFSNSVENNYLVDAVLLNKGYSSLADLKVNEELTYTKYKKNYIKR